MGKERCEGLHRACSCVGPGVPWSPPAVDLHSLCLSAPLNLPCSNLAARPGPCGRRRPCIAARNGQHCERIAYSISWTRTPLTQQRAIHTYHSLLREFNRRCCRLHAAVDHSTIRGRACDPRAPPRPRCAAGQWLDPDLRRGQQDEDPAGLCGGWIDGSLESG